VCCKKARAVVETSAHEEQRRGWYGMTAMAQQPTDNVKLAQAKRDLARRARRLAQLQAEPDRVQLSQFAAELDEEAEALERSVVSVCLPPVAAPSPQIQRQQVQQQQQSAEAPPRGTAPNEAK
jgi:hypothetical protein